MKFALVLKGLSYVEKMVHESDRCDPYTVDFNDSMKSFKEKIINPLRENGHNVDIFFHTNRSDKLISYINEINPVAVSLYDYNFSKSTNTSINKLMYEGCSLITQYNKNQDYDYIIITRFDLYIFENIMNLLNAYIPDIGISTITPNNDCFFIFNGCLLSTVENIFKWLYEKNESSHRYGEVAQVLGIQVHSFYNYNRPCTKESVQYPFHRLTRQIFTDKNHAYYNHTLEEANDPNSKHYAFNNPINKVYTNGVNIPNWWKPIKIEDLAGINTN